MGMQQPEFDELEDRASRAGLIDEFERLEARSRVASEIELMKAEGKALELSDEEVKMLHAFRRFKMRMRKDGEMFSWQTRKPDGVQIVEETANILHPSEVRD